jgi:hypothetical protein
MTISEYRELVARLPDPDPGFARDVAAARAELRPPRDANAG